MPVRRHLPQRQRTAIACTAAYLDGTDNVKYQIQNHNGREKDKSDKYKTQNRGDNVSNHQGDLKIKSLPGLIDKPAGLVLVHQPHNQAGDKPKKDTAYPYQNGDIFVIAARSGMRHINRGLWGIGHGQLLSKADHNNYWRR
jgi:hypothetical protein